MAFECKKGMRRCCISCGACEGDHQEVETCDACREPIYAGETVYDLGDAVLHEDCLALYFEDAKCCAE